MSVTFVVLSSENVLSLPLLLQGGGTVLMKAAWNGHPEVVKQLISSGARVDARTNRVSVRVTSHSCTVTAYIIMRRGGVRGVAAE